MSNIKTSPEEWALARSLFESGLILKSISEKTGASIPSLSKRSKKEGWRRASIDPGQINVPDDRIAAQIKTLAAYGLMDDEIAAVVGVKADELRITYERELTTASPEMVARVAQSMFKMATDSNKPNVTAAIFWLKCRGGWNDDPANAKLGKKEARLGAAKKAGTGKFSPAAPPRLVVNNK